MDVPNSSPAVTQKPHRSSKLPGILVLLLLLFLIPLSFIFSRWLLDQCVNAIKQETTPPVLGITNLGVDTNINQAAGGDVVTFNVTGNNTGPLSDGTVTFSTIGQGTITSAPVGSGICVVVSKNQATCTGVNLLSNEQLSYAVPVVVDAICGQTNGDIVGLNVDVNDLLTTTPQDATASGNIGCTMADDGTNPTPTSTTPTTTSNSNDDNSGNLAAGDVNTTTKTSDYDAQVLACYESSNNALMIAIGLSLLLILLIFLITSWAVHKEY